jgi:hypothetical protein
MNKIMPFKRAGGDYVGPFALLPSAMEGHINKMACWYQQEDSPDNKCWCWDPEFLSLWNCKKFVPLKNYLLIDILL